VVKKVNLVDFDSDPGILSSRLAQAEEDRAAAEQKLKLSQFKRWRKQ